MSTESPTFTELFEFWLGEEYKGYIALAKWDNVDWDITLRVPDEYYTKYTHRIVGTISNDGIYLVVTDRPPKYFNINNVSSHYKSPADPELFPWFKETLKREHPDEMAKIEPLL